ncbi:PREDICTED: 28S ribosomal protein S18c, mitochondrial [Charadrius vociferus]|uniref:28S ribosomal protein S18c, mitochondrial n=1 Tax=Charadrius vociferus TaxID=50402 RepID=UPI000521C59B|nr:PREDICTED: 28S ribosomal protein S18c, mitochondrial [Charadrius vociferus]
MRRSSASPTRECTRCGYVLKTCCPPIQMENPYKEPPKKCILCGIKVDYKNVQLLSQFISPHTGCIYGRHITGLCNKKQKEIAKAIKRAHVFGFMPVMFKNPSFLTDPKICDVKYPE